MANDWYKHNISDQNQSDINEQALRIIKIMEDENMNATQFAEAIGIQRAAMSHLMKGRNNPSADIITKVVKRFNTINPGWLLTGDGSMRTKPESGSGHINTTGDIFSGINYSKEPDLFTSHNNISPKITTSPNYSSSDDNIRTEILFTDEKNEGNEVNSKINTDKIVEKEIVVYKERPVKTIDKLLIFYSDNTFESFIPEKH